MVFKYFMYYFQDLTAYIFLFTSKFIVSTSLNAVSNLKI